MAKWIRIQTDWACEAKVTPLCDNMAQWEQQRSGPPSRTLPPISCDEHLPDDAEKIEDEAQPKENVG